MKKVILVILAGFLLMSCRSVGPKYSKPLLKTPETFRGADTSTSAADATSLADLKWFEVFKDDELQRLIRVALEQNYNLRDAVVRVQAARAELGLSRADQYPTAAAALDFASVRNVDQRRTFGGVSLDLLSFELDLWGRLRSATDASRAKLLASDENRKAVVTTLVADVAASYFNLLEVDAELDIARRTLATRDESLRLIRTREQNGLATTLDLRQGEQLVHTAGERIPALEQAVEQTENHIRLLLGQSPGPIERGRLLTEQEQPPSVPAGLPSALLERRPDIRAAEQTLIAANALIGVAKAEHYPRISLTGLLGSQSGELSSLFTGPAGVWQFVPRVTQPIFTGGRTRSSIELATDQQKLALIGYERVVQTAFHEVSDALIQHQKVREIDAKQNLLVGTLQDRSRLSYMRYRGGVDTLLSALDSDRDLFEAELELARTKRNELLTLVQLYRALGGGWQ